MTAAWTVLPSGDREGLNLRDLVDAPGTVEFLRQALLRISEEEIGSIAGLLARKRHVLAAPLADASLARPDEAAIRLVLRSVLATRRRADDILATFGAERLGREIRSLVHGEGLVEARFDRFEAALDALEPPVRRELAGECLHYADPGRWWLWSRWLWDPAARTGALPLVMTTEYDFSSPTGGGAYRRVGAATAAIAAAAADLGFGRMAGDPFAVDVYLAAIYGVYLATVTRLRMTQEFNRVVPPLPDLVRRLHGVHGLDA